MSQQYITEEDWQRYWSSQAISDRNEIALQNRGLVRKIAKQVFRRQICSEAEEDLIQIGFTGLINAVEKYDPSKCKGTFANFAATYIRGEIQHSQRGFTAAGMLSVDRTSRETWDEVQKLKQNLAQHGRALSADAIASKLGIEDWQSIDAAMRAAPCVDLHEEIHAVEEVKPTLLPRLLALATPSQRESLLAYARCGEKDSIATDAIEQLRERWEEVAA